MFLHCPLARVAWIQISSSWETRPHELSGGSGQSLDIRVAWQSVLLFHLFLAELWVLTSEVSPPTKCVLNHSGHYPKILLWSLKFQFWKIWKCLFSFWCILDNNLLSTWMNETNHSARAECFSSCSNSNRSWSGLPKKNEQTFCVLLGTKKKSFSVCKSDQSVLKKKGAILQIDVVFL